MTKWDEQYFQGKGLEDLIGSLGIQHSPMIGIKFFGQRSPHHVEFHGYNFLYDGDDHRQRDKKFQDVVAAYFRNKS